MQGKKGFFRNTAVMFAAMFISKGLGAVLKIPLGNILGGEGMGYFTTAYSIFTPVLSFACAGIPTVLTRTVASATASGEYGRIRTSRRCSLILALLVGIMGAALIFISAVPFVCYIANSPESLAGVLMIAPATVFCSVTAVYRGYYEGLSDTLPTALSQVIEAFVKALLGVGLSYFVYANGVRLFGSQQAALPYSAAAAILGITISEMCGMIFMLIRSRRRSDSFKEYGGKLTAGEMFDKCRDIFMQALPLSLGAAASNLLSLADMFTISNCIDLSASLFGGYWQENALLSACAAASSDVGNFMYGCYAGIIMSVYMLAGAVSGVVARCMYPRLAFAAQTGSRTASEREIKLLIKGTAVMTAPVTVFMAILSGPVLKLLYPVRVTEVAVSALPLAILSAGGIFSALLGAVCVVFNAYGDFAFPIKVTLIGGALKLILNVLFITIPFVNISGASLSAVVTNIICLIYASKAAVGKLGIDVPCIRCSVPSVFSAVGSAAAVYLFYRGLEGSIGNFAAMAVSAVLGCIMYALMLFISDSEDCTAVIRRLRRRDRA